MDLSIKHRNETFQEIKDRLPDSRKEVLECIKDLGAAKLDSICLNLNKRKFQLSGRITELKFLGFIKECGEDVSLYSNNKVTVYTCTTEEEQINIVNKRFIELRNKLDSLVNDFNLGLSRYSLDLIKKEKARIENKIDQLSKFA